MKLNLLIGEHKKEVMSVNLPHLLLLLLLLLPLMAAQLPPPLLLYRLSRTSSW